MGRWGPTPRPRICRLVDGRFGRFRGLALPDRFRDITRWQMADLGLLLNQHRGHSHVLARAVRPANIEESKMRTVLHQP